MNVAFSHETLSQIKYACVLMENVIMKTNKLDMSVYGNLRVYI